MPQILEEPVLKKCRECGRLFESFSSRKQKCNDCVLKSRRFCPKCGGGMSSDSKYDVCFDCWRVLRRAERMKQEYVALDVEYVGNVPRCPDCGELMYVDGRWSCPTDRTRCSVISLTGKGGRFKIVRDSVMAKEISGHAVMATVCSGNALVEVVS